MHNIQSHTLQTLQTTSSTCAKDLNSFFSAVREHVVYVCLCLCLFVSLYLCLCVCVYELQKSCQFQVKQDVSSAAVCRSCTGGKTEDFIAAAKLMHKAGGQVKVPTYLVPATQKVWMDVYGMPVPGCDGKTASQIFQEAGCDTPASPSCAACLGGPKDTYARMNKPEVCVSTTNR